MSKKYNLWVYFLKAVGFALQMHVSHPKPYMRYLVDRWTCFVCVIVILCFCYSGYIIHIVTFIYLSVVCLSICLLFLYQLCFVHSNNPILHGLLVYYRRVPFSLSILVILLFSSKYGGGEWNSCILNGQACFLLKFTVKVNYKYLPSKVELGFKRECTRTTSSKCGTMHVHVCMLLAGNTGCFLKNGNEWKESSHLWCN